MPDKRKPAPKPVPSVDDLLADCKRLREQSKMMQDKAIELANKIEAIKRRAAK
jgi:hypothetical protein